MKENEHKNRERNESEREREIEKERRRERERTTLAYRHLSFLSFDRKIRIRKEKFSPRPPGSD